LTLRTLFTRKPPVEKGYLGEDSFAAIYKAAEQQGRLLSGLRRTLTGN